jgi:sugar transferase (PEP-CTERM/EpsH1 system associated)
MRILWVKSDFLHPTTRGGQIRTLEMLRRLHARHEVDYIALDDGSQPEGPARAHEYSRRHFAIPHRVRDKRSAGFAMELAAGLFDPLPVAVSRYRSYAMRRRIAALDAEVRYDSIVCDFPVVAPNIPSLDRAVLFQHNVEAMIWRRHAANGATPAHRWYFERQARKMEEFERRTCRSVRGVIAVSAADARQMERDYGIDHVADVPTGVDVAFFTPPPAPEPKTDLVFLGSMDWMPNADGAEWFVSRVLPLIRATRPDCTLALAGRKPAPSVARLASIRGVTVTGEVPDVRPWLHGAKISIVPLRIGGGTRLKIYESMAAGVPVVSTTIGAEGLDARDGETLRLADEPEAFAAACVDLLNRESERTRLSAAARQMVANRYSWEAAAAAFERCLR